MEYACVYQLYSSTDADTLPTAAVPSADRGNRCEAPIGRLGMVRIVFQPQVMAMHSDLLIRVFSFIIKKSFPQIQQSARPAEETPT